MLKAESELDFWELAVDFMSWHNVGRNAVVGELAIDYSKIGEEWLYLEMREAYSPLFLYYRK